jgi:putative methylase
LFKKKHFISQIESLEGFKNPKIYLEQYTIDAISTADLIFYIGVDNQDIIGNLVIDLGAGTGRICLSSILFGAAGAVAIETDPDAINILKLNAEQLGISNKLLILETDIEAIFKNDKEEDIRSIISKINDFQNKITIDSDLMMRICIMNPPFGVHNRGIDRYFLLMSMRLSDIIYSIHLSGDTNKDFIQKFVLKQGFEAVSVYSQKLVLKGTYSFHKKPQKEIMTDVYKIIKIQK